jgi:hypothetical protein
MLTYAPNNAEATKAATLYSPNYWVTGYDYDNELDYTTQVLQTIQWWFSINGNNYGVNYNNVTYTDNTLKANYISNTQYVENNYDQYAVFSKGHIAPWANSGSGTAGTYYSLADNAGTLVKDSQDIYPLTTGKSKCTWIYHCGTAMSYPSTYSSTYGWSGMPMAWTHNNAMNYMSGYTSTSGNHVYVGFANFSHQFLDPAYRNSDYGYFVERTWMYLTYYRLSMSDALDEASYDTWNVNYYSQTPLYNGELIPDPISGTKFPSFMIVYGNGKNMGL